MSVERWKSARLDAEKATCGRSVEIADPRGRYNMNREMLNGDFAWSEIREAVECFRRRPESAIFRSRASTRKYTISTLNQFCESQFYEKDVYRLNTTSIDFSF